MNPRHVAARVRAIVPSGWRPRLSPAVEYAASPLAARRRLHRFVIVSGPRTGSELLRELLDSLPDVQCEGELLRDEVRWPLSLLNGRAALGGLGHLAWGCKILDSHLNERLRDSHPRGDQMLPALVADGWTIIHLRRQDLLAQALSFQHAMEGQWHFRQDPGFTPFEADPVKLIALLYSLDGNARWLEEQLTRVPHTVVSYEDDLRPPERRDAALARLGTLLGVDPHGAATDLRAGAPPRLEDRVTNLPEVVRVLEQTRFASLLAPRGPEG